MKITKRLYDIKPGTWINHKGEFIVIVSEYNEHHGYYEYHDTEIDDDGNGVELETGGIIAPSDLIGDTM